MTSWNEFFYAAEKPSDQFIPNKISPASIVKISKRINEVISKLMESYDNYRITGKITDNFRDYFGRLGGIEKKLIPESLLKLAEFCQIAGDYTARKKVLGALEFLSLEFDVNISRYDTSIN